MKVLGKYEKARIYIEEHTQLTDEEIRFRKRLNPGPCITISRETGIGAEKICEQLVDFFSKYSVEENRNWVYFDKNLIEKVMADHNLPERYDKFLEDQKPSQLNSFFGELFGVHPSKLSLFRKTVKTIYQLAEFGNVIIVGRGANLITAHLRNAFHVRLVAPLNYRIKTSQEIYGVDRKAAAEFIKKEDMARKEFFKTYFHKNIDDPLLYHIQINTHLLSFEEIAEMIGFMIIKKFPHLFEIPVNYME